MDPTDTSDKFIYCADWARSWIAKICTGRVLDATCTGAGNVIIKKPNLNQYIKRIRNFCMIFTTITKDLQKELKSNLPQIMVLLKKQPAIAYKKIGELGQEVGKKYNIELLVNFPHRGKIENFDMYGKQDLSLIVDMERAIQF